MAFLGARCGPAGPSVLTAVRLRPRLDCGSVLVVSVGVGCVLALPIKNRTSECAQVSSSVALRARGGGERAAPEVDHATAVSGGRLWRRERARQGPKRAGGWSTVLFRDFLRREAGRAGGRSRSSSSCPRPEDLVESRVRASRKPRRSRGCRHRAASRRRS